jgi:hypothetical protein
MIYGLLNSDDKEFNVTYHVKVAQMVQEIRISEDYWRSDIIVADMTYYTLAHILKVGVPIVKKFELCSLVSSLAIRNLYNRSSNVVI